MTTHIWGEAVEKGSILTVEFFPFCFTCLGFTGVFELPVFGLTWLNSMKRQLKSKVQRNRSKYNFPSCDIYCFSATEACSLPIAAGAEAVPVSPGTPHWGGRCCGPPRWATLLLSEPACGKRAPRCSGKPEARGQHAEWSLTPTTPCPSSAQGAGGAQGQSWGDAAGALGRVPKAWRWASAQLLLGAPFVCPSFRHQKIPAEAGDSALEVERYDSCQL